MQERNSKRKKGNLQFLRDPISCLPLGVVVVVTRTLATKLFHQAEYLFRVPRVHIEDSIQNLLVEERILALANSLLATKMVSLDLVERTRAERKLAGGVVAYSRGSLGAVALNNVTVDSIGGVHGDRTSDETGMNVLSIGSVDGTGAATITLNRTGRLTTTKRFLRKLTKTDSPRRKVRRERRITRRESRRETGHAEDRQL